MESTANRLKEYLEKNNLKQIDLVNMSGLARSAISQYLSGRIIPKLDKILILSKALHVDPAWLMGYDVPMEQSKFPDSIYHNTNLSLTEFQISILAICDSLNETGQKEAYKRLDELTQIDTYSKTLNVMPTANSSSDKNVILSAAYNGSSINIVELTEEEMQNAKEI